MTRHAWVGAPAVLTALGISVWPATASADLANFQLDGKIYNKFMFANDGTQGCVWLGNPAYPDNFTGDNGACSEFELGVRATITRRVKAGARIQSRWGAVWQDWWENGDEKDVSFPGDTSGESVGMNHAQYMKLRGFWIDFAPPIRTVENIRVGSSDLGMFSPWTFGKARYIDRDNYRGMFFLGSLEKAPLKYEAAVVALPKLFGGPGWNIGNDDPVLDNPAITNDWGYALKLTSQPADMLKLTAIGSYVNDKEFNLDDPDALGTTNPEGTKDGAIDLADRFRNANATLEVDVDPVDWLHVNALGAWSWTDVDPRYAFNGVAYAQGFTPIVYARNVYGNALKLRLDATDPLDVGLSAAVELFNIGGDYNSILGSRREADVLLTEGFVEGGQLPTLNVANEFQDWDEPFFESVIGWRGATLVATQIFGVSSLRGEYTFLTYNTNGESWDVDFTYPSFLYGDGFTDVDFYDYANTTDRGRDLRAVYTRNKDRHTQFFALWYDTVLGVGRGIDLKAKAKYIRDRDLRTARLGPGDPLTDDDYKGDIVQLRLQAGYQFTNELRGFIGDELNHWREDNRYPLSGGNLEAGYYGYITKKNRVFGGIEYNFGGVKLKYQAEWVVKEMDRFSDPVPGFFADLSEATGGWELVKYNDPIPRIYGNAAAYQVFNRLRTKASLEVAW